MAEITTPEQTPNAPTFDTFFQGLDEPTRALVEGQIKAVSHKAAQEAKGLRERTKSSEELVAKLKARFEVEELSDEFLDQLQKLPAERLTAEERSKQLERKLKERETEASTAKQELDKLRRTSAEKTRDEQVLAQLGKLGIRPEAMDSARKLMALDAQINEEGTWEFGGKPLEEYATTWAKANPYLLANPVAPGAATRAPLKSGNGSELTLEQWEAATDEWKRAHVDEFTKAMKAGTLK